MASGIPLPGLPGEALYRGSQIGQNLFNQLMQPAMQRAELGQQWKRHLDELAIKQQQQQRLAEEAARLQELHPLEMQYKHALTQQAMLGASPENQQLKTDLLEAKIASERARAQMLASGGHQRITAAVQEADAIFNGDRENPGWKQYVANKSRVYLPQEQQSNENEKLKSSPEYSEMEPYLKDAVDIGYMPVGSQNMYRKEMNEELKQIDKAKQVIHAISKAREITKMNPGLYKKAINIIANPEGIPGKIEKSLTALMPEKDVEAFMALHKLYSDILTKQSQLNNMSRSVYALRLQQQAKPQVKNPDEVNEQIFRNIEREIKPQIAREKPLLYAIKNNKYLPLTKNYGDENINAQPLPMEAHSPTPMGMMKGIIDGKEVNVRPEDRDDFIDLGGEIL